MKYLNLIFVAALSSLLMLASCEKDDNDESEPNKHEDAFADVFVKKVKSPQVDKYGLVFYAGWQGLTSCVATGPDGNEYELAEFWKGAGNMRKHPKDDEMQDEMSKTGEYSFMLTFEDGQTITLHDELKDEEIPAITGVNVTHEEGSEEVTATWNEVTGADNYMVKLTDQYKNRNEPIFNHKALSPSDTTYTFDKNTSDASPGWMQSGLPNAGDTSYVMVVAIKYEEGVEGAEKEQNKQMNTVKAVEIVW
ncbi:MAG: hypothetical protein ACLFT6_05720 [Bacteroidales bacterium]